MKIEIKSIFGSIIFEYDCENNSVRKTIIEALKSDADLRGADLRGADLRGADLRGAKNKESAIMPLFCKWPFGILGDKIKIGCKSKTIEEWELWFNSTEEFSTSRNTEEFKQIQACYVATKAYLTFLKIQ